MSFLQRRQDFVSSGAQLKAPHSAFGLHRLKDNVHLCPPCVLPFLCVIPETGSRHPKVKGLGNGPQSMLVQDTLVLLKAFSSHQEGEAQRAESSPAGDGSA